MTRPVVFMGPLPPPTHGFSIVNERMLSLLKRRVQTHVLDVRPKALKHGPKFAKGLRLFSFPIRLFLFAVHCIAKRPQSLYVGFSGGGGQVFDACFVALARTFGLRTYLHHHSFAYINEQNWLYRTTFRICRSAQHIVLCSRQGEALETVYGVDSANITVLSNVCFMDSPLVKACEEPRPFTIGFISNITEEKGIFDYFDVMEALCKEGVAVKGVIAGPVAARIADKFSERLASRPECVHVGPVYGQRKTEFFEAIDVLLFPTKYRNEAEPLVLWEAMSFGVPVVAGNRGCIECVVPASAGHVSVAATFCVNSAVRAVKRLAESDAELAAGRKAALSHFESSRISYVGVLSSLIERIAPDKDAA